MSPVIRFDIAVVAQKVKVQCCDIMADMLNLKKLGCWVSSRSGWLLELLTELTKKVCAICVKECLDMIFIHKFLYYKGTFYGFERIIMWIPYPWSTLSLG